MPRNICNAAQEFLTLTVEHANIISKVLLSQQISSTMEYMGKDPMSQYIYVLSVLFELLVLFKGFKACLGMFTTTHIDKDEKIVIQFDPQKILPSLFNESCNREKDPLFLSPELSLTFVFCSIFNTSESGTAGLFCSSLYFCNSSFLR